MNGIRVPRGPWRRAAPNDASIDAPAPDRLPKTVWLIAAIFVAVELAVSARYGFQQDELYFLVASHHLAFGYVDQPPLAVLLARTTDLFGMNPTAIRIPPRPGSRHCSARAAADGCSRRSPPRARRCCSARRI